MNKKYKQPFILSIDIEFLELVCGTKGASEGEAGGRNPYGETKSINIVDFSSESSDDW